MLKKDSKNANDTVNKLYELSYMTAGLTEQFAFVKGEFTVYEKLQGPVSVEKTENSYENVAHRITGLKENRKMNISKRPLAVTIRPREKYKFKSMEEVKKALQKSYRPSKDNVRIKKVVKREEDILVETDTLE